MGFNDVTSYPAVVTAVLGVWLHTLQCMETWHLCGNSARCCSPVSLFCMSNSAELKSDCACTGVISTQQRCNYFFKILFLWHLAEDRRPVFFGYGFGLSWT